MSEPTKYRVRTIEDMARIPEEAWPRFLAELPAILLLIEPLVAAYDTIGADRDAFDEMFKTLDWVDDDKGLATVDLTVRDEDGSDLAHSHSVIDMRAAGLA